MAAETNVAFDLLMGFAKDAEGQGEDAIIDAIFDAVFQGTPFAGLFDNGDTALIDKLSEQIQQLTENCREYFLAQTSINIDEQANPLGVHWVNVLDDWSSNYKSQSTFEDYIAQNPAPFGKYDPITKNPQGTADNISTWCLNILSAATNVTVLDAIQQKINDQMTVHDALDITNPFLQSVLAAVATGKACLKAINCQYDTDSLCKKINDDLQTFRSQFRSCFGNLDEIGALIAGLQSGGDNVRKMQFVLRNADNHQVITWYDPNNAYWGGTYNGEFNECYDFRGNNGCIPQGRSSWSAINFNAQKAIKTLRTSNDEGQANGWGDCDQYNRQGNYAGVVTALNHLGQLPQLTPLKGGDSKSYFPFQIFATVLNADPDTGTFTVPGTFMMDAWGSSNYLRSSRTDRNVEKCQFWVIDTSYSTSMQEEQTSLNTNFDWLTRRGTPPKRKITFKLPKNNPRRIKAKPRTQKNKKK